MNFIPFADNQAFGNFCPRKIIFWQNIHAKYTHTHTHTHTLTHDYEHFSPVSNCWTIEGPLSFHHLVKFKIHTFSDQ